jgi:hypothetical protein
MDAPSNLGAVPIQMANGNWVNAGETMMMKIKYLA